MFFLDFYFRHPPPKLLLQISHHNSDISNHLIQAVGLMQCFHPPYAMCVFFMLSFSRAGVVTKKKIIIMKYLLVAFNFYHVLCHFISDRNLVGASHRYLRPAMIAMPTTAKPTMLLIAKTVKVLPPLL